MCGHRLGRHHGLVKVDNAETSLDHVLEFPGHELGLPLDAALQGCVQDLGVPDLLLADVVPLVDQAVLGGADLAVRKPLQELSPTLGDGQADLPHDGVPAGDPADVLLVELSGLVE